MIKTTRIFALLAALACGSIQAQDPALSLEQRTFTVEQQPTGTKGIPADLNGNKTIFSPPDKMRPLKVAIYDDDGSGEGGVHNVSNRLLQIPGTQITMITAEEVGTIDLKAYDLLVFSGGLHRKQSATMGEAGQAAVTEYVLGGGRYLGVCAGAYLAMNGPSRLGMVNVQPIFPKRGRGFLDVQLSDDGLKTIQNMDTSFKVRYVNGPVVESARRADLPDYKVLAWFRSDTKLENAASGRMIDTPAIILAPFGRGQVLTISPHPENTPGLEHLIPRAVLAMFN